MSAEAEAGQKTLADDYYTNPRNLSEERLRDLYSARGSIAGVAREIGARTKRTRRHLIRTGIHEPDSHRQMSWEVEDLLPEDVGLSPLGCGDCGAEDIGDHPCPQCGYDPAGGDEDGE